MEIEELSSQIPKIGEAISNQLFYPEILSNLGNIGDRLYTTHPDRVYLVAALAPLRGPIRLKTVKLITVARFRVPYSVIQRVAHSLAPTILTTGILPVIDPISDLAIRLMERTNNFIEMLIDRSLLLYEKEKA